jgi:hypothetical protein
MKNVLFAIIAIWVGMASCDCGYLYKFSLTNKTDTTIVVRVRSGTGKSRWAHFTDTTLLIMKDSTMVIHETNTGPTGCGGFNSNKDMREEFDTLIVSRKAASSAKDYRESGRWTFNNSSGRNVFSSVVEQSEF